MEHALPVAIAKIRSNDSRMLSVITVYSSLLPRDH